MGPYPYQNNPFGEPVAKCLRLIFASKAFSTTSYNLHFACHDLKYAENATYFYFCKATNFGVTCCFKKFA